MNIPEVLVAMPWGFGSKAQELEELKELLSLQADLGVKADTANLLKNN